MDFSKFNVTEVLLIFITVLSLCLLYRYPCEISYCDIFYLCTEYWLQDGLNLFLLKRTEGSGKNFRFSEIKARSLNIYMPIFSITKELNLVLFNKNGSRVTQ